MNQPKSTEWQIVEGTGLSLIQQSAGATPAIIPINDSTVPQCLRPARPPTEHEYVSQPIGWLRRLGPSSTVYWDILISRSTFESSQEPHVLQNRSSDKSNFDTKHRTARGWVHPPAVPVNLCVTIYPYDEMKSTN
ncbi:hypothetical protein TsFJ059_009256 [Trichoderma semiorbis]|uniref:Uncharacterized protein n=1 Tax=Trichoderma semiorbis TaxID=1491008 RepID=A0A9P8KTE8_9HYPO|nr:hypothetical protein TsFJ059_009256 [Trichoderma semiorbis]KAH0525846.1 hypothetical protein TsFJ059_009256 [Trichoderma semiorbis]